MNALQFLLPNLDRKLLIYWDSEAKKNTVIDTETMFDGDYDDPDFDDVTLGSIKKYGHTEILFYKPRTCRILGEVSK